MFAFIHERAVGSATDAPPRARRVRASTRPTAPARRLLARLGEAGSVAIEFAIVAPMFFLLLLTIIDFGMMLATQSLLDGAARDAARLIRTGQVQTQSSPIGTFQNLLCSDLSAVMTTTNCQANVLFNVQTFSDFGAVATNGFTTCTQNENSTGTGTPCTFAATTAGEIVGVQATYQRPFMIPWVGACLTGGSCWFGVGTRNGSATGTNTVPLMSTVIFRNEPFP